MRSIRLITGICVLLACGCATAPSTPASPPPNGAKATPLILERDEGERRTARVHLGEAVRVVHAGATVFIPAGTRVSVANIGHDAIKLAFIFSAPGFEGFMREESVRLGERNTPVSKSDDDRFTREHAKDVIYK